MKTYLCITLLLLLIPIKVFALGAIAVAENTGKGQSVYVIVSGYTTGAEAIQQALNKCKDRGGIACKIVLEFERCGSIATSAKSFGVGSGVTGKIARNMSLRSCGDDCRVFANECEDY